MLPVYVIHKSPLLLPANSSIKVDFPPRSLMHPEELAPTSGANKYHLQGLSATANVI